MSIKAQKLRSITDKHNNIALYHHLSKVISNLALNAQTVNYFEECSFNLKNQPQQEIVFKIRQAYSHIRNYQVNTRALIGKLNSGTEEDPQEPSSIGYVPNCMQEAKIFEKFGYGFGEEITYCIFKSLCKFAMKKGSKQIRLWGKILGSEKDYYVAQAIVEGGDDGQLSPDTEPRGTGVNKDSFWVATELTGEWTELPIISPQQLVISRKIKYLFTGDLGREILTNPQFPGKQSHLLKCQIVRIQTACSIVPKGSFVLNADDPNQIEAPEEYLYPDITTLGSIDSWVYFRNSILKNGRTTILKPEGLQPQEEEKAIKEMNLKDPSEPRLKNLAMDTHAWSLKTCGMNQKFKKLGKDFKTVCHGAVAIRSMIWPGWVSVAYEDKMSSLYVGYGHKFNQNYYPLEPETVLQAQEDHEEVVIND